MKLTFYLNQLRPMFTREDKRRYVLLLFLLGIGAILDFVGLGMIPAFVALLASPEKFDSMPVVGGFLPQSTGSPAAGLFFIGAAVMLGVFAVKTAYFAFLFRVQFRLVAKHRVAIAERLFRAYMNAPWTFHLQRNSAELLRNITAETTEIMNGVLLPLLGVALGAMMTALIFALVLVSLPWQCWLAFIVLGMASGGLFSRFKRRLTVVGKEAKVERKRMIQSVNEGLAAILDARIMGKEGFLIRRFRRSMVRFAEAERYRNFVRTTFPYILETVAVAGVLVILGLLLRSADSFNEVLPELALVGAAVMRLRQTLARLFGGLSQVHFSKVAIAHVAEHLRTLEPNEIERTRLADAGGRLMVFREVIRFSGVSFGYPGVGRPAVRDLTLSIGKGESVAFVGPTGSGKSTAINLLLGLLEPAEGEITVDGESIHPYPARWQRLIGYVPQTIHLLDDTIRRNIAFGVSAKEVDEERLREVIRQARLEETILAMEDGLDTMIGERGVRLSGGQRQRLGIARALYREPQLLVMDEGTSALDNRTEWQVIEALRRLGGALTTVLVAHRISTVTHCDRVFFLNHGRLEAAEKHEHLLLQHEEYRAMVAGADW